jgi:hypothetical protein
MEQEAGFRPEMFLCKRALILNRDREHERGINVISLLAANFV